MVLPPQQQQITTTRNIKKRRSHSMRSISSSTSSSEISIADGNSHKSNVLQKLRKQTSIVDDDLEDDDDIYCGVVDPHALICQDYIQRLQQNITSIHHIPYIHSSYAAASPKLLHSPEWMAILKTLMPHLDFTIQRSDRMMQQCENNPVICAFGVLHNHQPLAPLEWDVFLDPQLVHTNTASPEQLVCRMMLAHGSAAQLLVEATGLVQQWTFETLVATAQESCDKLRSGMFCHVWLQLFASALQMGSAIQRKESIEDTASLREESGGRDSKKRLPPREERQEAKELLQSPSTMTQSFRSTRSSSRMGSTSTVEPTSEEDPLSTSLDNDKSTTSSTLFCGMSSSSAADVCGIFPYYHNDDTHDTKSILQQIGKSLSIIQSILGQPLRLILDLKSRFVPSHVWSGLIQTLEQLGGLSITAIGSFDISELRSIQSEECRKYLFFHSAGDLQYACERGEMERGDVVFFNAGSLIRGRRKRRVVGSVTSCCIVPISPTNYEEANNRVELEPQQLDDEYYGGLVFYPFAYPRDHPNSYSASNKKKNKTKKRNTTLQDYQDAYQLQIGLYVQEVAIGPQELNGLVQFINQHSSLYNVGLAWGGLDGCHFQDITGTGYGTQRYVGRVWDDTTFTKTR
mmetsp:Transcript_11180/g.17283  ORF Transcript_11180/g.17283 Transcript_11180/m.17283 type:complete len:630 (-) Transcript_11180:66-1955(-)